MSSKRSVGDPSLTVEKTVLDLVRWRRVGVVFWSLVVILPTMVLVDVPYMLFVPVLLGRIALICYSLYNNLGLRYRSRILLLFIDLVLFLLAFISTEWNKYDNGDLNMKHIENLIYSS